ncbi:protein SOSEKI 3-like isoform X2 [Zingiber officinale]|uniref:protein SOSEKI 3-like isoform X2 n=1 Tax=Zingiber officinale TaxID=94328 RepID=UPI001C4CD386|nr:protein SOSEKI 3-like isoform X2 [Zingiber officinale]XP_042472711.1 protein SOSEKI 3-like isoform X2 [Zingiber officinale]
MEARMRRYAPRSSPERTKVWTEPPAKHQLQQQGKRVPVVYYLCRNRHLEHPHFVEVPLSSPDGLFLRDVIDKLNAQRGKRMAAMYSWSCKRSYKNGFVWHDLSEDDLILPAHGNEYVLKGSEILDQTPPDRRDRDSSNAKIQNMKNNSVQEPPISCKNQEASFLPSSAEVLIKVAKLPSPLLIQPPPPPQEDDPSSSIHVSPEPGRRTSLLHEISSPKPAELRIQKPFVSQDASTQTEDRGGRRNGLNTRIMGVSTDDKPLEVRYNRRQSELTMRSNEESEIVKEESLPSSTVSSSAKTNTLESLIREEVSLRNNYKNGEAEEVFLSTGSKFRATNMLMHMFTCGSISVKDHYGIGFAADYKPRLSDAKFTSPMPSTSVALQEISFLPESQRAIVPRLNKKQHFSGSMIETNKFKERRLEGVPKLKRSSSFNEDRSYDMPCSTMESEKIGDSSQPKYPSRASKNISNMSSMFDDNATKISPVSDARKSSAWMDIPRSSPLRSSTDGSKRSRECDPDKGSSIGLKSFQEFKEKAYFWS